MILKIDDAELAKVPREGPLIAAANHVNFLDAPVLITHLYPRKTTGLVKKETWDKPFLAFLFNLWEGIPIDRDIADFVAFKQAKQALKDKKILAVTPEGTRSEDGQLKRGKPGISILASKTDAPIIPIAYWGHENFIRNIKRLKRTPMNIKVGKTFRLNFSGKTKSKELMQDAADAVLLEIKKLLPEKYHGVYSEISIEDESLIQFLD
ncbi:MAG: lysophospholipid acyltransferase family protein [Brevefilum sp.]|nr:lysophospholipid acyltransferase family protein [Brevefilum sp.]MDT8380812.1 lysophospholipid acyltransferase family protein [Brevefilum sp.]MDW7754686.1 lysophospholipid acyltransferase family protein [Brevefilum sp.]